MIDPSADWNPREEESQDRIRRVIDKFGVAFMNVCSCYGGPSFTYTVGMRRDGKPDLVVSGLSGPMSAMLLEGARAEIVENDLDLSQVTELNQVLEGCPARVVRIPATRVPGLMAHTVVYDKRNLEARAPVDAYQLLWPDTDGNFPGDEGMNAEMEQAQRLIYDMVPAVDEHSASRH